MNEKKAKALRKAIYGNGSKRNDATYVRLKNGKGGIFCHPDSLRFKYQRMKRQVPYFK